MNLPAVATALGCRPTGRNRWSPCPACRAATESRSSRGPLHLHREHWHCNACHLSGDAIGLLAVAEGLDPVPRGRDFIRLRDRLDDLHGLAPVEPAEPEPPKYPDLEPALDALRPLTEAPARVQRWLRGRHIEPTTAPAAYLPPSFHAPWWPWRCFDVAVGAYTGLGELRSIHATASDRRHAPRKVTWPLDHDSRGLLFLDRRSRAWLRGEADPPAAVLICEGLTDFLAAACRYDAAIIGYASGSDGALMTLARRLPATTRVGAAVDADEAGDRYAARIAAALRPHTVRRLPLSGESRQSEGAA